MPRFLSASTIAFSASMVLATPVHADPASPAPNPFLAAPSGAITHFDSGQSDTTPNPIPRGTFRVDLTTAPRVPRGPVNIVTLASTSPDFMWGVSGRGVTYIDVSEGGFRPVAEIAPPGRTLVPAAANETVGAQSFESVEQIVRAINETYGDATQSGGAYSFVDRDNRLYFNLPDRIVVFGVDAAHRISILAQREFAGLFDTGEALRGMQLTYDGRIVVVGARSISIMDRSLTGSVYRVAFGVDEDISNGVAVDEANGIYVASDRFMRKVVWTGTRLSIDEADGAWIAPYETGQRPPTIKVSGGTGSTPTLMGFGPDADRLVVITDGANRMNLVAFWRDEIPADARPKAGTLSPRIAGQIAVRAGLPETTPWVQNEQSVVVGDYGAFVVNNIGPGQSLLPPRPGEDWTGLSTRVNVMGIGPVGPAPRGVERFEWDVERNAWRSVWARGDVSSPSMIPTLSTASNVVLVNSWSDTDGWGLTGMDWATGETVTRVVFGRRNVGNGAYAQIQLFPNGDLLFNSLVGPRRVQLR